MWVRSNYYIDRGHNESNLALSTPMSESNPHDTDAILGGHNPLPVTAAVLGGEDGRKQRIQHKRAQKFWQNFEYLNGRPYHHAINFADRQVVNFEPNLEIINPQEIAYAIRVSHRNYENESIDNKLAALIDNDRVSQVKALVLGFCNYSDDHGLILINSLAHNIKLTGIKSIFLGDIEDSEMMISHIYQGDISAVLTGYSNLELLHIRGGSGCGTKARGRLRFTEVKHDKLKTLRIESGGLNHETLVDLNRLDLPALEYLELWLGREEYGGNSKIDDLMAIISGDKFPKLKYLGLRNCEYANDIAFELVKSSFVKQITEIYLSMGTLENEGFLKLANCPMLNELDTLNVSSNHIDINQKYIDDIFPQFKVECQIDISNQKPIEYYDDRFHRYCTVGE